MEAMFQGAQQNALRAGVVLTREEFWRTPGQLLITPQGYVELMRAGVVSMAFLQQFRVPRNNLQTMLPGRN